MFDAIEALKQYVRYPSVSTDPAFADGMAGAREFIKDQLAALELEVEEIPTELHPIILARREGPASWPHVVVYGHYDVQPPDPLELWTSPAFEPEIRGDRLYGRGAADNKGPQMVHLAALHRVLSRHPELPLRITFLIEGEEEMGSPSFPGFLRRHAERLRGDFLLLSDTGCFSEDQMLITTGLRGLAGLQVTAIGPNRDLHSGVHGGPVMNPIEALAQLCASLKTREGRVDIPGFYDDVIEPLDWDREELKRLPFDDTDYAQDLGVDAFRPAPGYTVNESLRFAPTLEFNGIGGGYQGEGSKTVLPSKAFAKITCRLVANQRWRDIEGKLVRTLQERCPPGIRLEFKSSGGGEPYVVVPPGRPNTPADQPPALARAFATAESALTEGWGRPPVYVREGGSVPIIASLKEAAGLDSLMIGLFTPRDNLHAPDEGFHLRIMERAIPVFERLFASAAGIE